ncbi:hypothetical protein HY642_03110 [Candidatus Woesearchaeota archaeon]|nr:hypothetical protein [Candidatus Woesearchaeota archaeon]
MAIDIDKLREDDRLPVAHVVDYLRSSGLEVELVGAAGVGDRKYSYAALLALGSYESVLHAVSRLGTLSQDGLSYSCTSTSSCTLEDELVRCKFSIKYQDAGMDIGFRVVGEAAQPDVLAGVLAPYRSDGQLLIPFGPSYNRGAGVDPNAETRVLRRDATADIARHLLTAEQAHARAVADLYDDIPDSGNSLKRVADAWRNPCGEILGPEQKCVMFEGLGTQQRPVLDQSDVPPWPAGAAKEDFDNEEGGSSTFGWERDDPDAVGC